MILTNYHTHTKFSDGQADPEEYVLEAIRKGMHSLGFSEHSPVNDNFKWTMKTERLYSYFEKINSLKQKFSSEIQIYCGLELDYIPGTKDFIDLSFFKDLDYSIGSVHFLSNPNEGKYWTIDGTADEFETAFREEYLSDPKFLISSHYEKIRDMAVKYKPSIIGHIDKIKLHNIENKFFSEEESYYEEEVVKTLEVIRDENLFIEFNTRGLYKHKNRQPYPSIAFLKQASYFDIPVVLNSDAHQPSDLTNSFYEAVQILRQADYKKIFYLDKGTWKSQDI